MWHGDMSRRRHIDALNGMMNNDLSFFFSGFVLCCLLFLKCCPVKLVTKPIDYEKKDTKLVERL